MITRYELNCIICGKPTDISPHHLVFGRALRQLADADDLIIPICFECHEELHKMKVSKALSRICGQLAFEKTKVAEGMTEDEARECFRKRYGISYL